MYSHTIALQLVKMVRHMNQLSNWLHFVQCQDLSVIRPADANETAAAWNIAVSSKNTPTALVLSRQNLPVLPKSAELAMEGVKKGAYIVSPATKEKADAILNCDWI